MYLESQHLGDRGKGTVSNLRTARSYISNPCLNQEKKIKATKPQLAVVWRFALVVNHVKPRVRCLMQTSSNKPQSTCKVNRQQAWRPIGRLSTHVGETSGKAGERTSLILRV